MKTSHLRESRTRRPGRLAVAKRLEKIGESVEIISQRLNHVIGELAEINRIHPSRMHLAAAYTALKHAARILAVS